MNAEERFWAKVNKTDYCWEWTAYRRSGYGMFYLNGGHRSAHRVSWEWQNGPVPDGLVIDHVCRNTGCVRPDHLRVVTQRENVMSGRTIPAAEAAKTECVHGHPLSGENVRIDARGYRECLTCTRRRMAERDARHHEKANGGLIYPWMTVPQRETLVRLAANSDAAAHPATLEALERRGLIVVDSLGRRTLTESGIARAGGDR